MTSAAQMSHLMPSQPALRRQRTGRRRSLKSGTAVGADRHVDALHLHLEFESSRRQHGRDRKARPAHLSLALPGKLPLFFPFAAQPHRVCPA
jgi:hypothetical protein